MEYDAMSTYREDIAELISAQIEKALEKEYDRGWDECMKYYWSKREVNVNELAKEIEKNDQGKYREEDDPYGG